MRLQARISMLHPHTCLVGCLLVLQSVSLAAGYSYYYGRDTYQTLSDECSSYQELYQYKPCPKESCFEGGISQRQCCLYYSRDFFGNVLTKECRCDYMSRCAQVSIQPIVRPPVVVTVAPTPPPLVEKADAGKMYCSYAFEINSYKPCPMEFCNSSSPSKDLCCKQRNFFSLPETCRCHPHESCDLSKLDKPVDDCDENENDKSDDSPNKGPDDKADDSAKGSSDDKPDDSSIKKSDGKTEEDNDDNDDEAPRSLCADRFRLLNADKVTDPCKYKGVAKLIRREENKDALVCNAVYTIAQIKGTVQHTFLTPQACGILIEESSRDFSLDLQVGDQTFPVQQPIFGTETGPNGNWYVTIGPRYTNLFRDLGACQSNACPYDPGAMRGKVDFNNCKAVSYGASDASTFTTDGLYETSIAFYPGGCLEQEDFFGADNTLCFRTIDDENAYCANDAGAPVYCRSSSTEEWILLGMLAFQNKCDTQAELKVIPFPL